MLATFWVFTRFPAECRQFRKRGSAMQAHSMDLRVRGMADVDAGLGTQATADKYRVSAD